MAITVYWSMLENEWLRSEEPISIHKKFMQRCPSNASSIFYCPAIKDYHKNLYGIKSIYDYSFSIENGGIVASDKYDQSFFNNHLVIRDLDKRLFSFSQSYIFFCEQDLEMALGIFPFMEENEITKRTITVGGKFNIGKWFRNIDFAFFLKNEYDKFIINCDDIYNYIQFYTDEDVVFKKFQPTVKIKELSSATVNCARNRNFLHRKLSDYYSYFNIRKQVINEIKSNLLD